MPDCVQCDYEKEFKRYAHEIESALADLANNDAESREWDHFDDVVGDIVKDYFEFMPKKPCTCGTHLNFLADALCA